VDGEAVAETESLSLGNGVNGIAAALYKPIEAAQLQEAG